MRPRRRASAARGGGRCGACDIASGWAPEAGAERHKPRGRAGGGAHGGARAHGGALGKCWATGLGAAQFSDSQRTKPNASRGSARPGPHSSGGRKSLHQARSLTCERGDGHPSRAVRRHQRYGRSIWEERWKDSPDVSRRSIGRQKKTYCKSTTWPLSRTRWHLPRRGAQCAPRRRGWALNLAHPVWPPSAHHKRLPSPRGSAHSFSAPVPLSRTNKETRAASHTQCAALCRPINRLMQVSSCRCNHSSHLTAPFLLNRSAKVQPNLTTTYSPMLPGVTDIGQNAWPNLGRSIDRHRPNLGDIGPSINDIDRNLATIDQSWPISGEC